jgi:hypothetical protein
MFMLGSLPILREHIPDQGNEKKKRERKKKYYGKHLGFSALPNSSLEQFHQVPGLSKKGYHWAWGIRI